MECSNLFGYGQVYGCPKFFQVFGLPKTDVAAISEMVITALERWQEFAASTSVSQEDADKVAKIIRY